MNFSLDNYTLSQILAQALEITYNLLQGSATDKDFFTKLAQAFGENFNVSVAKDIAQDWAKEEFKDLPTIELRAASEVNGAMGAFASATNKIYLSKEFISRNATNPETIASVLLEEIGHYIDFRINKNDSSGDEGAIFSALVRGQVLDEQQLRLLRAEDDSAKIVLDGQMLVIEQANFTGSPNDDVLPASGNGNGGDDTFVPLFGQDNVDGGAGNDLLIVNYSANTYGGSTPSAGLVSQTLSFSNGIDAAAGFSGSLYAYKDSNFNSDSISFARIERFQITGTNYADRIISGSGNDTLIGGAGDDQFTSGGGIDSIDGGTGIDILIDGNFSSQTTGLTINNSGTVLS